MQWLSNNARKQLYCPVGLKYKHILESKYIPKNSPFPTSEDKKEEIREKQAKGRRAS